MVVATYPGVPLARVDDVHGAADADFRVVAERELSAGQALVRRLLCERPREAFGLVEGAVGAAEEPLAEHHVRLDLALLACERVVLHAQQRVEWERRGRELARVPELVLRRREVEVRRTLEVLPRFLRGHDARSEERLEQVWWDGHVLELV